MQTPPPSFSAEIRQLFRDRDRSAMTFRFDLWQYADVKAHAAEILAVTEAGAMPCDGRWPEERVALLRRWIDGGCQP